MRSGALAVVLPAAAMVQPVLAQQTGTRIGITVGKKDGEFLMQHTAACVAQRWPDKVRALLATAPGSAEEAANFDKLGMRVDVCIEENDDLVIKDEVDGLKMNSFALRRWLGTAMLMERYRPLPAALTLHERDWFGGAVPANRIATDERYASYLLGRCVVARDWVNSRKLLLSQAGTSGEREAMRALAPTVVPCVPHDYAMTIRPTFLRGVLGETAYQLMSDGGATAVAGKN